ncbi:MAG: hypothetical protein QHH75_11200, partial [Bacillota bacterium]|nr:hypothetical protein [Bacillota bacterium]
EYIKLLARIKFSKDRVLHGNLLLIRKSRKLLFQATTAFPGSLMSAFALIDARYFLPGLLFRKPDRTETSPRLGTPTASPRVRNEKSGGSRTRFCFQS